MNFPREGRGFRSDPILSWTGTFSQCYPVLLSGKCHSNSNWSSYGGPNLCQKVTAQQASTGYWKRQYPSPNLLIGNALVTYVRRHVTSPRLMYHHWVAGCRLGSSVKTWVCDAPAAYLNSRCDLRQLDAIISCQCALACLVYTRIGLVFL